MQFTMYLAYVNEFRVEGLDLADNIYHFPEEWMLGKLKHPYSEGYGNRLTFTTNFILMLDSDVIKESGKEELISLFQSNSEVYLEQQLDLRNIPYNGTADGKTVNYEWMKYFLLEDQAHNPFKWEKLQHNDVLYAKAYNNITLAINAINYWKQVDEHFKLKKELYAMEQEQKQLDIKVKDFKYKLDRSGLPSLFDTTDDEE